MSNTRLLLCIALLPIFIIGFFIYRADKIKKESKRMLCIVTLGGVLSVLITLLLSQFLEMALPFYAASNEEKLNLLRLIPYYFLGVALIEELAKWIMVYVFCWKSKEFDYLYDAIVYCVFSALGFAAIENIFYVLTGGIGTGILRGIFSIPGHAFFAVYMGYFLGISKLLSIKGNKRKSNRYFIYSFLAPFLLHGTFDYLLAASSKSLLFFPIFLIFIVLLYIFSIKMVKRISNVQVSMYE